MPEEPSLPSESRSESSPERLSSPSFAPGAFLRVWFALGVQSFGGGTATLALIRRASVEQYGWLTEAEFTRYWALCQITPGINLIGLTLLIGRKTAGLQGALLALLGLLLPSVSITILMTAGYARVQHWHSAQAALRGVLPATLGLGMATAWQMGRSLLTVPPGERRSVLPLSLLLLVGSGALVAWARSPVLLVLLLAGGIQGLDFWRRRRNQEREVRG